MSVATVPLICPRCRHLSDDGRFVFFALEAEGEGRRVDLLHLPARCSVLVCSNPHCRGSYPVIDGIPVVFKDPGAVDLAANPPWDPSAWSGRALMALVDGRPFGSPVSELLARLARYAWAGFWDRFPGHLQPAMAGVAVHGAEVADWVRSVPPDGAATQGVSALMGAAFAREAFDLSGPTVAVEAHLPTVRAARRLAATGRLEVPVPVSATRWEVVRLEVAPAPDVRFLCADVLDPPLPAESFSCLLATNLVDSVHDPVNLLGQLHALLAPEGRLFLTTPFAWKSAVTPAARWLECVVPEARGDPARALEVVMSTWRPPLRVLDRRRFRWIMRHADREHTVYDSEGWCFAR